MVGLGGLEPPTSPLSVVRSKSGRLEFIGIYLQEITKVLFMPGESTMITLSSSFSKML